MFALRSSPSSLVCDLRNTLLPGAEGGFQLSAPRPRRASVRLGFDIYYAGTDGYYNGEADGGFSNGGGGGGSAFSPAVSDYAGVFEAGDPARARESMDNFGAAAAARPTGLVERAPRDDDDLGGEGRQETRLAAAGAEERRAAADGDGAAAGWSVAPDDHDESSPEEDGGGGLEEDFLFEMEGLKEEHQQHERGMRVSNGRGSRTTGGDRGGAEAWGAAAITGAAAAAASDRGAGSRGEVVGSGAVVATPGIFHAAPTHASLSPPSLPSGGGKQHQRVGAAAAVASGAAEVGGGGGTELRKPRVIAPRGTRCIGGGMYRLRLSTSC